MPIKLRDKKGRIPKSSLNMWTFCDEGCYTDLKHGRCWVDSEDWPKVKDLYWFSYLNSKTKGIYVASNKKIGRISLHRFILGLDKEKIEGDHKDRNGLNNSRINLRRCTHSENNCNRIVRKDSQTQHKGILLEKRPRKKRFIARITKEKKVYRKTFLTLEEAIEWRIQKEKELHGEFARRG